MRVGIVGGGWAGSSCARALADAGCRVEIFEATPTIGGHARAERLNGVVYEPNGPHIFHTNDEEVVAFVRRFGMRRQYEHRVLACIHPNGDDEAVLVSWPPQIDELRSLQRWPQIEKELACRPDQPTGDDFESYAISLMGSTLYELFIYGYTLKQWGSEPQTLSSKFAPKRLDIRHDGHRGLFRDRYQFFETDGFNSIIERIAAPAAIHTSVALHLSDLVQLGSEFDSWVVTGALDDFVERPGTLAWRGIENRARYLPVEFASETVTAAYVVNYPDPRYPFTRTVESKHATGQLTTGTVVCEEHPGAPARHYPVPTVDGRYEQLNTALMDEIRVSSPVPVNFCGRLARYNYINQDEAIRQGLACARRLLEQS
jgi:UDP-galactopyranose mutase